ncbi:hypothetical protein E2C01_095361 [Portunus trituberculatus]|uniref:Uncharacterized protein n=1 Tax=Portunus trituberculatus TaxID=210409 RepID=A0A5B7K5J9_PORTR|nr:hypothetical protein [Portunus trituberculatus]
MKHANISDSGNVPVLTCSETEREGERREMAVEGLREAEEEEVMVVVVVVVEEEASCYALSPRASSHHLSVVAATEVN